MARSTAKSQAGDKKSGADAKAKSKPKKERMALSVGIPYPVERSFYDPKQDCVIDVLRVEKTVQNKRGDEVPITIFRKEYCKDEAIQAKYKRQPNTQVEVTDVE